MYENEMPKALPVDDSSSYHPVNAPASQYPEFTQITPPTHRTQAQGQQTQPQSQLQSQSGVPMQNHAAQMTNTLPAQTQHMQMQPGVIGVFPNNPQAGHQQVALDATYAGQHMLKKGLVVRRKPQYAQMVLQDQGVPMIRRNHYFVGSMPDYAQAKRTHKDDGYAPSKYELETMERLLVIHEESTCGDRALALFCSGNPGNRNLKLRFTMTPTGDILTATKPFALGGCCGQPMKTFLRLGGLNESGQTIGRVTEDFRFAECCFKCTYYNDLEVGNEEVGFTKRFTIRANLCCCGRVNNCCGATCCKNDKVFDILNTNGELVSTMTQTYGGDCCRMAGNFNTYTLEFPPETTWQERWLLLTSMIQLDYQIGQSKPKDNNDSSS